MPIAAQYIPDPETEAYYNSPEGLRASARGMREWAAELIQFAENKEAEAREIEASAAPPRAPSVAPGDER